MSQFDNPFDEHSTNPYQGYEPPVAPPKPVTSPPVSSPSYAQGGASSNQRDLELTADALRRKEQELIRKEQDLEARERILSEREANIKRPRPANWPRWPKPLVHQDIQKDIEGESLRRHVRKMWIGWHALLFFLVWNLVVMTGCLAVDSAVEDFVLAIVYIFVWGPITFLIYRLLYNGARRGKALTYFLFFVLLGFQILFHCFWLVGLVGSGMGGFIWMINLFKNKSGDGSQTVAILCVINIFFMACHLIFTIIMWFQTRPFYAQRGGMAATQKQFVQESGKQAAKHPDVVYDVGKTAVKSSV